MALIYYGSQIFGGLTILLYPKLHHWSAIQASDWLTNSVNGQFAFFVLAEGFTLGFVYLFLRRYKRGFSSIGLHRPRLRDLAYGLAGVPLYFIFYFTTVVVVAALVPSFNVEQQQQIGFEHVRGALPLILTFLSLVVLPPIIEEIVVRGLLYTSFKKALPLAWAVVSTSALFAAAHLPEGGDSGPLYIAALDTFILSLVLIYLREKTGSLWASITLHSIKNGVAYVALFIAPLVHLNLH